MKLFKSILLGLTVGLVFANCDPLERVGPSICPTEDFIFNSEAIEFNIVGDNAGSLINAGNEVSLNGSGIHVYSKFSEVVKWKVDIEMKNGSSKKHYSGESDSINVFWYGNSKSLPLFSEGEAKITVSIACNDPLIKEFSITDNPTFKNLDTQYGVLIRDWDQNGSFPVKEIGAPDFSWGVGDGFNWAVSAEVEYKNEDPSPFGGYYLSMKDKKPVSVWYYGTTGIDGASFRKFDDILESLPTTNPEQLWFNVYVKGDQIYKNTSLELEWGKLKGETYNRTEHLNWEGWKMVSFPFTEFTDGTDPMPDFYGFKSDTYIGFQLGSQPAQDTEAQASFDFAIITVGGPFFEE
jgi:hypothetical protein